MPRRTPWLSLSAATLLALLLSACSSGGGKINTTAAAPATTSTAPATTELPSTTSTTTLESKVLADLKAARETTDRLGGAPNLEDPALTQYMSGPFLDTYRSFLQGLIHDGEVVRHGQIDRRSRLVSVQGTKAVVYECDTNDGKSVFVDAKTGRVIGPRGQAGTTGYHLDLLLQAGTWTLNDSGVKAEACS